VLSAIRSRLELKVLLLIIAVLMIGFGTYVVLSIQRESEALIAQQRDQLRIATEALTAGIRNVMLTGKSPFAVEMVNDLRNNVKFVDVTIYDRFGREVFLREGEGVNPDVNDPILPEVLRSGAARSAMVPTDSGSVATRYAPLSNRPECWRCHEPGEPLRGVLQVALRPAVAQSMGDRRAMRQVASTLTNAVAIAFRTIMLGGNGAQMDTLIGSALQIPGVRLVQVYDRMGFLYFGPEDEQVPEEQLTQLMKPASADHRFEEGPDRLRVFAPLVNEDRCQVCHGGKFPMRGILVVDFDRSSIIRYASDPEGEFTAALQKSVLEGFRSIMLVGRASSARFFMDEVRDQQVLQTLRVFDLNGHERFLNPPPRSRPELKRVIEDRDTLEFREGTGDDERMVRIVHLPNEPRCHSCHGSKHDVRAAVEVSASMATINAMIRENQMRSAWVGGGTILLVWVLLRIFMSRVVVRPVQEIERVASRVGAGDLSVEAHVGTLDEIGTLARRINDMVRGLRERLHLQRFVSQGTVEAVRRSALDGVAIGGVRKTATAFFSDIRGFTSYAEQVEPERVVRMLNAILSAQADVVRAHGGDIDKYVGDELVAVFEGEGMAERAVRAALEIQRTAHEALPPEDRDIVTIGIGIHVGEMVMGAMGSPERMDYTVIGDSVNLAARLCSAASGGQVLISDALASRLSSPDWCRLRELEPMAVKGKRSKVKVWSVDLPGPTRRSRRASVAAPR
jgi:adenylate cyclase